MIIRERGAYEEAESARFRANDHRRRSCRRRCHKAPLRTSPFDKLRAGPDHDDAEERQALRGRFRERQPIEGRRRRHLRRQGLQDDDRGRRRARRARRRRVHSRARSEPDRRRLERPAERRRRRPARCVLHARAEETRRWRGGHRRRPRAGQGCAARRERNRSPSPRRQGRAGLRAVDGHQDRARVDQRRRPPALARMEAPHRSAALPRSEEAVRRRGTTPACRWCAKD